MSETPAENYQIILEKVPYEKQPDASLFLSGCFSLPPASTRGIAASGPIALISDLGKSQAESILAELDVTLPEGVELRLATGDEAAKISRLQWPRPPHVYGRELAEFRAQRESHNLNCPHCGGRIRITRDAKGQINVSGAASERRRVSSRRLAPVDDNDVLFSGIKPLATGTANLASLRSLQAGDTGFWMDYSHNTIAPTPSEEQRSEGPGEGKKKGTAKSSAGLAAFMKPGVFAVVVGRTKEPQVVKTVADIMGTSEEEARTKCLSLGILVARDISLDEAQNLLTRFKSLGAKARIVKPM